MSEARTHHLPTERRLLESVRRERAGRRTFDKKSFQGDRNYFDYVRLAIRNVGECGVVVLQQLWQQETP